MIRIFKKCEKSVDNPYGIIDIKSYEEINKPFLFCISSLEDDNSSFGIVKEGARAARVRTTDELAGGFKINEMGVDFIGYKNDIDGHFNNLVDDFLYPMLVKDKEVSKIKKNARRMNFFVYCNAAQAYLMIEKRLHERLLLDNYSEEEIKDILSQISVVAIATNIDLNKSSATTIVFKDACDRDVYDKLSKIGEKQMLSNSRLSTIINLKNGIAYVFYGSSEHALKSYLKDENMVKPSLCATVCRLIENSIENEKTDELISINPRLILPIILRNNGEFSDVRETLEKIDNSINYGIVGRYSESENEELKYFEESLKEGHRL